VSLFDDAAPPGEPAVRTVSELLADVKAVLGEAFPESWVRGELSSFKHHDSGHMYFALKDAAGSTRGDRLIAALRELFALGDDDPTTLPAE